jgi:hypothetical protein
MIDREDIMNVLSDGEWHPLYEMLPLAKKAVPPEKAVRAYVRKQNKNDRENASNRDIDYRISIGRRCALEDKLWSLVRHGYVEKQGRGFDKRYRTTGTWGKKNARHVSGTGTSECGEGLGQENVGQDSQGNGEVATEHPG